MKTKNLRKNLAIGFDNKSGNLFRDRNSELVMKEMIRVLMKLEDFVLSENGLAGAGYVHFEHDGKQALGFPYIRSSHERFFRMMIRAREILEPHHESIRFLEVGCGIGTKCEIARQLGFTATGIDLDPRYLEMACRIFPDVNFLEANALDFDYSGYDLVYYHTPLATESLMRKLEKRILGSMPSGALLCVTKLTENICQNLAIEDDSTAQWRKSILPVRLDEEGRLYGLQKLADIPDLELLVGPDADQDLRS